MEKTAKKPYQKPKVIHETRLEVRAGTPIGPDSILNPLKSPLNSQPLPVDPPDGDD